MPSIFKKLLNLPPGGMGRAVVGKKPDDQNATGIAVTAAVFFDGTGNNRNNTAQRRMAEHNRAHPDDPIYTEEDVAFDPTGYNKYGKNKQGKPKDSYEAGYSNVSILERMNTKRKPADKAVSLYVEGIGTTNNEGDDNKGGGFGIGPTGVKARVLIGVGRLAEGIAQVLKDQRNTYVEKLTIDVFGFSRGATAARHFVSLLNDDTPLAARLGIPKAEVIIRFVGVFDTVSSYGFSLTGFGSDVEELGLALGAVPQKVVHLAAANEHRKNFSLTDITSSLQAGKGYELVLPGVHSNIGGSYGEVTDEEERDLHDWECERLVAQGWYRTEEIARTPHHVYDQYTGQLQYTTYSAVGRRRNLTWEYQFIPLGIMHAAADKHLELYPLAPGSRHEKYTLPAEHPLTPVQQAIERQVAGHGEQGRHVLQFPHDPALPFPSAPDAPGVPVDVGFDLVKRVRNRYLHRSASLGMFTDGRVGMAERRKKDQPHRLVFKG